MARASPVRVGMATAFRQPSLVGAEVAWRWSFGIAALGLAAGTFAGFLNSLFVSDRDLMALGSRNQDLVSAAIAHIFQGSGPRLVRALVVLLPALALLWSLAASVGRTVTLRAIIPNAARTHWLSMLALHLARAVLGASALIAALGIIVFAAQVTSSPDADGLVRPNESAYLLILLFTLPVLALFWNYLNSMFALAPVFVVRDGVGAVSSVVLAARALRDYRGRLLGTAALFAVLRIVAIGALLVASLLAVAAFSAAGFRVTMAILMLLTLGYFLVVDFLYMARLVATVEICLGDETPADTTTQIVPPISISPSPASSVP